MLRGSSDKLLGMSAIALGHLPLGIVGLSFFGIPNLQSLKFILASSFLHFSYQLVLLNAYRQSELSQVYPVARGLSPPIIVLVSTIFIGDQLSGYELLGVLCVSIVLIAYGIKISLASKASIKGFFFAASAGGFIASYSLLDGYGVRIAQNAIGFYSAVTIINGLIFCLFLFIFSKETFPRLILQGQKTFWIGGSASYVAYAIVVWACLHLPISVVYTLRETSILFAVLLATLFLKEKLTVSKILLIGIVCIGVGLIKSDL